MTVLVAIIFVDCTRVTEKQKVWLEPIGEIELWQGLGMMQSAPRLCPRVG